MSKDLVKILKEAAKTLHNDFHQYCSDIGLEHLKSKEEPGVHFYHDKSASKVLTKDVKSSLEGSGYKRQFVKGKPDHFYTQGEHVVQMKTSDDGKHVRHLKSWKQSLK